MPPPRRFGELLAAARQRAGLTQQELADRVSEASGAFVTQQHISNWSRGRHLPRDRCTLLALCQTLYRTGGLKGVDEINALLLAADEGALHEDELAGWLPELLDDSAGGAGGREGSNEREREEVRPAGQGPAIERAVGPEAGAAIPDRSFAPLKMEGGGGQRTAWPEAEGSPEPKRWYTRVVDQVERLAQTLESPERHGMVAAIAVATLLVGSAWQSPASLDGHLAQVIVLAGSLWAGTLVLAAPPSPVERAVGARPPWRLKLYRLSGAACGVFILAGLLLWAEGLSQLLAGDPLPRGLIYLLAAAGAIFAYAGGAQVQQSFNQGEAGPSFYTRTAAQVSTMMMLAQALLVAFLAMIQPLWSSVTFLLILVPAGWMLWHSLRRRTKGTGGTEAPPRWGGWGG